MDILNTATDWAKAEVFSTKFFILFGIAFEIACIGFWQLGKTDLARAYIYPTLVAGILLMTVGIGLLYTNTTRITTFAADHEKDASAFLNSEIKRGEATLKEYGVVFKVIPLIIIAAALIVIFVNTPIWRAISITTIAMMIVILLVDGNAHARIKDYHEKLVEAEKR